MEIPKTLVMIPAYNIHGFASRRIIMNRVTWWCSGFFLVLFVFSMGCEPECDSDIQCSSISSSSCVDVKCLDGVCTEVDRQDGISCGGEKMGSCTGKLCWSGMCLLSWFKDGRKCESDLNDCTSDGCRNGICKHEPVLDGTACGSAGYKCKSGKCSPPVALCVCVTNKQDFNCLQGSCIYGSQVSGKNIYACFGKTPGKGSKLTVKFRYNSSASSYYSQPVLTIAYSGSGNAISQNFAFPSRIPGNGTLSLSPVSVSTGSEITVSLTSGDWCASAAIESINLE